MGLVFDVHNRSTGVISAGEILVPFACKTPGLIFLHKGLSVNGFLQFKVASLPALLMQSVLKSTLFREVARGNINNLPWR